jgi:hypothetical protein
VKRLAIVCFFGALGCAAGGRGGRLESAGAGAGPATSGATAGTNGAGACGVAAPPATGGITGAGGDPRGAAGQPGTDAGSRPAGRDGASSDAAVVPDAIADVSSEGPSVGGGPGTSADGPRAVGCAGATLALCEDFESGAIDPKIWKPTQNNGTATLDPTRGARGSQRSLHVHVDPGSDTTVGIVEAKTFPALAKKLFARAFIYIPGANSTALFTGDRHSRLIYAQGSNPYGEYALGIWNGGLIQNHYSPADDSQDTKMLPPFDQWFCLEYELDAAAGNVRAYLNDIEIVGLRHDGWPATNVATLMFGVDRFGTFTVAEDLWFDDLAVDGARIGCTR